MDQVNLDSSHFFEYCTVFCGYFGHVAVDLSLALTSGDWSRCDLVLEDFWCDAPHLVLLSIAVWADPQDPKVYGVLLSKQGLLLSFCHVDPGLDRFSLYAPQFHVAHP